MKWFVVLVTILVFGLAFWVWFKPKPVATAPLESKIINLGKVEISATPEKVKVGESLVFKLALTTHSVELNYDFTQVIAAGDDRGNSYPAVNWSGGSGGHHLEGEITFDRLKPGARQLKLIFTDIDQKGGELSWEL
ncbi:hypothetical protein A3I57_02535 [Candidatus Beckwithbacteria bacterium RIFCSPLOWO2_02_FULL_47_23]|uniref:DUF4352 domain-containing protein n=2 Tax=Candidatus Beckwithiibacteriota TaxID=1752726 RepID=A0A1F5DVG4_9BACT|nr:MAG: hypothetical protein A3E73_02950 [Candidatus Beckwithbacteria bacterium RIFCSPHIGHO2_12_FULL_47_17]OGD59006.1 MAG: hypothetical protein A3I57_02535 [Candidatus Beckwithbacteria bacterium RIFCSPLOWO2_02_FULL_47_23]